MRNSNLFLIIVLSCFTLFSSLYAHDNSIPPQQYFSFEIYSPQPIFLVPYVDKTNDEELIQKVQAAIGSIYGDSKKIKFGTFDVDKSDSEITVKGTMEFYKEDISISSTFTTGRKLLNIKGSFSPNTQLSKKNFKRITTGANFKDWFPKAIQKSIVVDNVSIAFDENTQKPSELSLTLASAQSWNLIEGGTLRMNQITGTLNVQNPTTSKSFDAQLAGNVKIANTDITIKSSVGNSKEAWSFGGELQNLSITDVLKSVVGSISGVPMPDGFLDASIVKSSFEIAPAAKKFSLSGTGAIGGQELGDIQFLVEPKDNKKSSSLSFLIGIAPSPSFKLAKIDSGLGIIDELGISNFGLVLSSDARASSSLDVFEKLGGSPNIGRGLNFIGAYDLTALDLDDLIGVKSLMVRAVVSNNFSDMLLEASVNTTIPIGDIATFKKILFRLKPSNMEVSMGGEMEVIVDGDKLLFNAMMGVDVADQALFVEGSMTGMWNEPFNTKGLSIGDLWMKFGVSFRTTPIPLPEMGIAGKLKASNFEGDLLLVINTNNPTESAIDVGFNEINIKSILESFCDKQTLSNIPAEIRNTVLDISLKNARLTVVPRPMNFNNTSYDAGFRVKGDASIGDDFDAKLDVSVGYDGVEASAGVSKISHPPFFELKGSRGKEDPSIEIVAKLNKDPKVAITGSATLLGITAESEMMLNDAGFDMYVAGKIFDAFKAEVEVSGSRVKDGGSFRVAATMEQDFLTYFTKHASEEIDKATEQTQDDITTAQNDVSNAQREVSKLEGDINTQRGIVKKERDRDLASLRTAQQDVANERTKVQRVQNNINAAHNEIGNIDARISAKDKWVNDGGDPFTIAARGVEALPYFTEQAALRVAKMAEIAGLETGKATADAALYLAEKTVQGMHMIGNEVPIDMDPRVSGIIVAKETAIGSMEAAKYIMEGGKIIGVGTLQATKWIIENGPLSVVNVTYAHFEGKLSGTHGGTVTLHIKGTFADEPFDEKITFNFNNPLDEVVEFAESLLD